MEDAFKKARLHRVYPMGSVERRYGLYAGTKAGWGAGARNTHKSVCSTMMVVFAHVISQSYFTCHAHMLLLHVLRQGNYNLVCLCHITSWRKQFGTHGSVRFMDFVYWETSQMTLDIMQVTFRTQIQKWFKVLVDARRNAFETIWTNRKLLLKCASAPSATRQVIATRIARLPPLVAQEMRRAHLEVLEILQHRQQGLVVVLRPTMGSCDEWQLCNVTN